MPVTDVLGVVRDDLDACFAVGEGDEGEGAGFMDDRLCALFVREAVGDGDVTVIEGIDTRHVFAEESAVGGGVAELVDGDVIVDHLMEDGVLDEGFGQVDAGVDAEDEVLIAVAAEETLLAAGEGEFAEEAFGVGEADGDRRKGAVEVTGVVGVEMGLYVGDGGDHGFVKNYLLVKNHLYKPIFLRSEKNLRQGDEVFFRSTIKDN